MEDVSTLFPLEFFFEAPVVQGQEDCLDEAITIELDRRLEGVEIFYIVVNSSLSTPPGVRYGEDFLVLITDDGM